MDQPNINKRKFGRTGIDVTCVGLGGEGILRTFGQEKAAQMVINEAIHQGISYFDSANAYAGSEGYYGLVWPKQPDIRAKIFQASKSAQRNRSSAMKDLDNTLSTMGVNHIDLWQIHDVRSHQEIDVIASPGGALEAFLAAKSTGKIRFLGVTGHHDPEVLTRAVRELPVDAVMMPVNPVEAVLGGFLDSTLTAAIEKGVAVIGMKVLGASQYLLPQAGVTAQSLIRFALSYPISVAIVGCSSPQHVQVLAAAGRVSEPLSDQERSSLTEIFQPYARRLAYYRGVL